MIGERLQRARKAEGLSLRELATQVGVSHTLINKYEKNEGMPDSAKLLKLAKALHVRTEYFFRPKVKDLDRVEFRKRKSLPVKRLRAIELEVLDVIERRMEIESLFPTPPVASFEVPTSISPSISSYDQLEEVANALHREWDLGRNPIPDLVDLLEVHGIRVFLIDARNDPKFDGLSARVGSLPIVVIGKHWPGDRQRFTLSHELGHLILDGRISPELDIEKACNRFAGAFLFPKSAFHSEIGFSRTSLEIRELSTLKLKYGLSMMAILYRACDLGVISSSSFQSRAIYFRRKGWHKCEPGSAVPSEQARVFEQLVFRALAEDYIGESKAAELFGLKIKEFVEYRNLEESNAGPC